MNNQQIAERIKKLVRLDVEMMWNYDRAINDIEQDDVREQLQSFRDDHFDHFRSLSEYLKQLGETMPESDEISEGGLPGDLYTTDKKVDFKNAISTLIRDEKALNNQFHQSANEIGVPEIVTELEQDIEDDEEHIQTMKAMLNT